MDYCWKQDAINHAKECDPDEACGVVAIKDHKEIYFPCKNISNEFKAESFVIDPLDWADIEDTVDEIVGIVHSHPQDILEFSETDRFSCKAIDLPFYLVSPKSDKIAVIRPEEIDVKKN